MRDSMKPKWSVVSLTIVAVKIAALSLLSLMATLALNSFPPNGMRRQDAQDARLLIAIATVSAALAVLLLTRRNSVRVLINTPILLVSTIVGIVVALESASEAHDFAARVWRLFLIGGSCGAFFGHILLAIGWAFASWLKRRRPDDRGSSTETSISAWRWEPKGSDAG
jgi:NADH:ubiquinone oxidoreductase subunit K